MNYNLNLVAQISLLFSFVGLVQMVISKMSALSGLSEREDVIENKRGFWPDLKKKVIDENPLRKINYAEVLGKILKSIRVFFLKADNKLFGWTQKLKEDSQKKKIKEDGDYWDKIKKDTD